MFRPVLILAESGSKKALPSDRFCQDSRVGRERMDSNIFQEKLEAKIMTAEDILNLPPQPSLWVVDKLIPEGCTFLSGLPKHYKSYLSLHLADCLTSGLPFLGKFQVKKKRVMYQS